MNIITFLLHLRNKSILFRYFFIVSSLALTGCGVVISSDASAPQLLKIGNTAIRSGDTYLASTAYSQLTLSYPYTPEGEKGMLGLMYAYYQNNEYTLALGTVQQLFIMYPKSSMIGYGYYVRGLVLFSYGRNIIQKRLPYNMADRNPDNYFLAFNAFKDAYNATGLAVIYKNDALRHMMYLRDTIARYYYNLAVFYRTRHLYSAALNNLDIILIKYSQSPIIDMAFEQKADTYTDLQLYATAKKIIEFMKQHGANTQAINRADAYLTAAQKNKNNIIQTIK